MQHVACGSYWDFFDRGLLLTRKLLNQGFLLVKMVSGRSLLLLYSVFPSKHETPRSSESCRYITFKTDKRNEIKLHSTCNKINVTY